MGSARFDLEKLTDKIDFGLWKVKMKALLIQQGLGSAIAKKSESASGKEKEKSEDQDLINDKAHSMIILCLGDKALREVSKETTAMGVWQKLESIYMVKSLANRLYMKQKLYSFKMSEDKPIVKQIDDFNKILDDLENIEIKLEEEDRALILLSALPKSMESFKDTLLFGSRETISLDDVQMALRCKELHKATEAGLASSTGEGPPLASINATLSPQFYVLQQVFWANQNLFKCRSNEGQIKNSTHILKREMRSNQS